MGPNEEFLALLLFSITGYNKHGAKIGEPDHSPESLTWVLAGPKLVSKIISISTSSRAISKSFTNGPDARSAKSVKTEI
jgi:homoserine acetyltransferase